jgi:transcriptional regulator with XRE-family HTH domain
MDRSGERLKRARERLKLTYRDVEQASQVIAARRGSEDFAIALSRLADIENKGTLPTIYRLYSLCAIYRLDYEEVLRWYGVPVEQMAADALQIGLAETHAVRFAGRGEGAVFEALDPEVDVNKTSFLGNLVSRLGKLPLDFARGPDGRAKRYGLIGMEDWSMHPILHPGSLIVIDETRRKIVNSGWATEYDRPIYFLEHRRGYCCGWCWAQGDRLMIQFHPASNRPPETLSLPSEVDVVGQVTGVAMRFENPVRRVAHARAIPEVSPCR